MSTAASMSCWVMRRCPSCCETLQVRRAASTKTSIHNDCRLVGRRSQRRRRLGGGAKSIDGFAAAATAACAWAALAGTASPGRDAVDGCLATLAWVVDAGRRAPVRLLLYRGVRRMLGL